MKQKLVWIVIISFLLCVMGVRNQVLAPDKSKRLVLKLNNERNNKLIPPAKTIKTVTWDDDLSQKAHQYGQNCNSTDSRYVDSPNPLITNPEVATVIFQQSGGLDVDVETFVQKMFEISKNYDFVKANCTGGPLACAYYLIASYENLTEVGCAFLNCPALAYSKGIICHFHPIMNDLSGKVRPYTPTTDVNPVIVPGKSIVENLWIIAIPFGVFLLFVVIGALYAIIVVIARVYDKVEKTIEARNERILNEHEKKELETWRDEYNVLVVEDDDYEDYVASGQFNPAVEKYLLNNDFISMNGVDETTTIQDPMLKMQRPDELEFVQEMPTDKMPDQTEQSEVNQISETKQQSEEQSEEEEVEEEENLNKK